MNLQPTKAPATVTSDGRSLRKTIDGLNIKRLTLQQDARGGLVELFSNEWKYHAASLCYAYSVSVEPRALRGWVLHKKQDDRIVVLSGCLTWAFYDDRPESPTYKLLNLFTFGERDRQLFTIPAGVYHAVKNVSQAEAIFLNFPSLPYNHADPDKYRLPLKNELIPFDFSQLKEGEIW